MKLTGKYDFWTVTQAQFAQIVGLTQSRISRMIDEGILKRGDTASGIPFVENLKKYYEYKFGIAGDIDGKAEMARLTKAKRELTEMEVAQRRSELLEAAQVENFVVETLTNFRNKFSGFPAKLSLQLEGKTVTQINKILTAEVEDLLIELARTFKNAEFTETADEGGSGDDAD